MQINGRMKPHTLFFSACIGVWLRHITCFACLVNYVFYGAFGLANKSFRRQLACLSLADCGWWWADRCVNRRYL